MPIWICEADARLWPCLEARRLLIAQFHDDPMGLVVFMYEMATDAAHDFHALSAETMPGARTLYERFVAWTPAARLDAAEG